MDPRAFPETDHASDGTSGSVAPAAGKLEADHAQPQSDDGIGTRVRRAAAYCLAPVRLRRTMIITIVVGTILTLLNQGDVIVSGAATTTTLVKTGLNYVVPFVVSNLGTLSGRDTGA